MRDNFLTERTTRLQGERPGGEMSGGAAFEPLRTKYIWEETCSDQETKLSPVSWQ